MLIRVKLIYVIAMLCMAGYPLHSDRYERRYISAAHTPLQSSIVAEPAYTHELVSPASKQTLEHSGTYRRYANGFTNPSFVLESTLSRQPPRTAAVPKAASVVGVPR